LADPAPALWFTYEEYLAFERESGERHEFLDGAVVAMSGGTPQHALLAMNVGASLHLQLRGRPCRVYSADLRVHVTATGLTTYPDLSVVCGRPESPPGDPHAVANPAVLVEVLSATSEAYDRGEKFAHFRRIPSLQHYLLVAQRRRRVELYTRGGDGRWTFVEAGPGESLELNAIGGALAIDDVYEGFEGEALALVTGKYASLYEWLRGQEGERVSVSFEALDGVLGGLPRSARTHQAWWQGSVDGSPQHVQKRAWGSAGFSVEKIDLDAERVVFRRLA